MSHALQEQFPYTQINQGLPPALRQQLDKIITYRFGNMTASSMMTVEIRSYVEPGQTYRFTPGNLTLNPQPASLVGLPAQIVVPKQVELRGEWTDIRTPAQLEANILGDFNIFYTEQDQLLLPVEVATAEKLAYYRCLLVRAGESLRIESSQDLPVTIMRLEKNYKDGYLKLPEYGGGYYLEVHDTPHFWSPLTPDCAGVLLLGKKVGQGRYHLTAFTIPFGSAVYAPGGVIHSDGLLIGDIMTIYTVTPNFSTVILKNKLDAVVAVELTG